MRIFKSIVPVLVIVGTLAITDVASACPNCKEATANQEGSDAALLSRGYGWSIIMMITAPFSMLTAGAFVVARAVKRGSLPEM